MKKYGFVIHSFPADRFQEWAAYLSKDSQQALGKFYHPIDAYRSLMGQLLAHLAVLELVQEYDSTSTWNDVEIKRDSYGKRHVSKPQHHPPAFNISHHGDYVVVLACSNANQVGIDIVQVDITKKHDFYACFQDYFTLKERQSIYQSLKGEFKQEQEQDVEYQMACAHRFAQCWSCKEAYVKMKGCGLGMELNRIHISCIWQESSCMASRHK